MIQISAYLLHNTTAPITQALVLCIKRDSTIKASVVGTDSVIMCKFALRFASPTLPPMLIIIM